MRLRMHVDPMNWDFSHANNAPSTGVQSSTSSPAIQASVSISATSNQQAAIARHLANSSLSTDFNAVQHISIPGMQISIGPANAHGLNFNMPTSNNATSSPFSPTNLMPRTTPGSPSSSRVEQIATQAAAQAAANAALQQFQQTLHYDYAGAVNGSQAPMPYHHHHIHHQPHQHQLSAFHQEPQQGDPIAYPNDLSSYAYQQAAGNLNLSHRGHPHPQRNGSNWITYPYVNRERLIGRHMARLPTRFVPTMHFLDRSLEDIVRLEENLLNANRGANQETIEANTLPYKYSKVSSF